MFRSLIKDADTEKQVRALFEDAGGMGHVKTRYQELLGKHEGVNTEHQSLMGNIADLRADYQRGDFDSFFEKLKIPQEKIVDWLVSKVEYGKLPEDQRRILDRNRDADRRAYETEKQSQAREQMYLTELTQARDYAVTSLLDRSETKAIADDYDARVGEPGSFRKLVIERGEAAWYRSKGQVDLTPEQAIQEALKLIGAGNPAAAGTQAGGAPGTPATKPPVNTLPNVGGRSGSPVKQKPQSLDDLKKIYASM